MTIKPLADLVLVEPSEIAETKSTGGIIIPDTAKEKPAPAGHPCGMGDIY